MKNSFLDNVSIQHHVEPKHILQIHAFLKDSYWAKNIPLETVQRSISNSLNFVALHNDELVAFARLITDGATFAYLADVFVEADFRGKGISKKLMEHIMNHPNVVGLRRMLLVTKDAHGLYQGFGFEALSNPEGFMTVHKPNIYQ